MKIVKKGKTDMFEGRTLLEVLQNNFFIILFK
jgi:hypothetical protein